jgi:uncharacterized OB-fold protein
MALIKCPECERDISDKAISCPNCGYQTPQPRCITCKSTNIVRISDESQFVTAFLQALTNKGVDVLAGKTYICKHCDTSW